MNVEQYLASRLSDDLLRMAANAREASPLYAGLAERLEAEALVIADVEGRRANGLVKA